jgi:hypothetical protein
MQSYLDELSKLAGLKITCLRYDDSLEVVV